MREEFYAMDTYRVGGIIEMEFCNTLQLANVSTLRLLSYFVFYRSFKFVL
jgi:hypothetical protein